MTPTDRPASQARPEIARPEDVSAPDPGRERWRSDVRARAVAETPERCARFVSTSDLEYRDLYAPADTAGLDEERDLDALAPDEKRRFERLGLGPAPREAVEDDSFRGVRAAQALDEHLDRDRVGDELPALHVAVRLATEGRPRADRVAEQVPGRHVWKPQPLREDGRLGALPGTRRPEQDEDSHRMKPS